MMANDGTLRNVTACRLVKGGTTSESVTCTNGGQDYPASAPMPAATRYLVVQCASACVVAMGEATSATVGVGVTAGIVTRFPVVPTGVTADDKPHVQSPTGGAVVRLTYMGA